MQIMISFGEVQPNIHMAFMQYLLEEYELVFWTEIQDFSNLFNPCSSLFGLF